MLNMYFNKISNNWGGRANLAIYYRSGLSPIVIQQGIMVSFESHIPIY